MSKAAFEVITILEKHLFSYVGSIEDIGKVFRLFRWSVEADRLLIDQTLSNFLPNKSHGGNPDVVAAGRFEGVV